MEKFRYTKEGEDKCRQWIWWKKSCYNCSFDMLCLFQQNQERIWKDTVKAKNNLEKK